MMKQFLILSGWTIAIAAVLIGFRTVASHSADEVQKPADYLKTATYITTAKCKMCHKAQFTAWNKTVHGQNNVQAPWDKDKAENAAAKLPPPEVIYRYTTGYNPATNKWSELGTTCESCHGPGSAHMKATSTTRKETIMNPEKLATQGQKLSVCGRCHGQYTIGDKKYAADYFPGQDLLKTEGFKLDPVEPGKKMQELNEFVASKHHATGDMSCTTCHTSHAAGDAPKNLKKPVVELCTGCHTDITMANHAPAAEPDATCATCHMPDGSHTFAKP